MKSILLRKHETGGTVDIIKAVIENPPNGATIPEVRARCRVLDAVEANLSPDELRLEDGDHATLCQALNNFRFGRVSRELLSFADDILNARTLPAVVKAIG